MLPTGSVRCQEGIETSAAQQPRGGRIWHQVSLLTAPWTSDGFAPFTDADSTTKVSRGSKGLAG